LTGRGAKDRKTEGPKDRKGENHLKSRDFIFAAGEGGRVKWAYINILLSIIVRHQEDYSGEAGEGL